MNTFSIKELDGSITDYVRDQNGVIKQLYPQKFKYDPKYVSVYDKPQYSKKSDVLQSIRFNFIRAMLQETKLESLIDIGYGNGAFLSHVRSVDPEIVLYGHDITGIEPPKGVFETEGDEWILMPGNTVMTFWDCLEHFPDLSFLSAISSNYIVVSLPWCHFNRISPHHCDSVLGVEWFSNWHHRKPNEHLHHFDKDSLIRTFEMYGWRCIGSTNAEDMIRRGSSSRNILTAAFKR